MLDHLKVFVSLTLFVLFGEQKTVSKVGQHRLVLMNEDVLGLEVSVDHSLSEKPLQPEDHVLKERKSQRERQEAIVILDEG